MTSTPTRPVDNVVITTKGLQDRNINILDGMTVENKGKLILIGTGRMKGYFQIFGKETVIRTQDIKDQVVCKSQ